MRDYLYVWNDPRERLLVASGIEVRDLVAFFSRGGLVLLEHRLDTAACDPVTGLDYLPASRLPDLASERVHGWGNFRFADYDGDSFPRVRPEQIAELLYFAHAGVPLRRVRIDGIANRFLVAIHDDGWCAHVRYRRWLDAERLLAVARPDVSRELWARLKDGDGAFWVEHGAVIPEERTLDIDSVLNRRTRVPSRWWSRARRKRRRRSGERAAGPPRRRSAAARSCRA